MSAKEVVVFFTGGTIGMDAAPGQGGAAPGNNQGRIFNALGKAWVNVGLKTIAWADLPSPHITPEIMLRLSQDLEAQLARSEVAGAVVLHGTDLLAETAFFLEIALASAKPVVLTGSMLHMSQAGYDGLRNLEDSLAVCLAAGPNRGVLVQMAGEIFQANDVVKADSISVSPMLAQRRGHVGRVVEGEAIFFRPPEGDAAIEALLPKPVTALAGEVEAIKCFPGMGGDYVHYAMEKGLRGLVVEGFGAGNVPPGLVGALENAAARGVAVILTTRCLRGGVYPIYGYNGGGAQLLRAGLINGHGLTSDKALLLLKVALGCGCNLKTIEALCAYYGRA